MSVEWRIATCVELYATQRVSSIATALAIFVARKSYCCGSQSRCTRAMSSKALTIAFGFDYKSPWLALGLGIRGIACTLDHLGNKVVQVDGIKDLVERLASGEHKEWDLVFNIAEGLHGLAREAQVPCLLEAYGIPFTFADAATTALCLDKGRTKVKMHRWHDFIQGY